MKKMKKMKKNRKNKRRRNNKKIKELLRRYLIAVKIVMKNSIDKIIIADLLVSLSHLLGKKIKRLIKVMKVNR